MSLSAESKTEAIRVCSTCDTPKLLAEGYHKDARIPSGFKFQCKDCLNARRRRYRSVPGIARKEMLWSRYRLTLERYDDMFQKQEGRCGICKRTTSYLLCIDHDHSCCPGMISCGKCVRGLLCKVCNVFLGYINDDPTRVSEYLD